MYSHKTLDLSDKQKRLKKINFFFILLKDYQRSLAQTFQYLRLSEDTE
jgi:hypothetical protein